MDKIVIKALKELSLEGASAKFIELYNEASPSKENLDLCVTFLKKGIYRVLTKDYPTPELLHLTKAILCCCKVTLSYLRNTKDYIVIVNYLYHLCHTLITKSDCLDEAVMVSEALYAHLVKRILFKLTPSDIQELKTIASNSSSLFWTKASSKNPSLIEVGKISEAIKAYQVSLKMFLFDPDCDLKMIMERIVRVLRIITANNPKPKKQIDQLLSEVSGALIANDVSCSKKCRLKEKQIWFFVLLVDAFLALDLNMELQSVCDLPKWRISMTTGIRDLKTCPACSHSKGEKHFLNNCVEVVFSLCSLCNTASSKSFKHQIDYFKNLVTDFFGMFGSEDFLSKCSSSVNKKVLYRVAIAVTQDSKNWKKYETKFSPLDCLLLKDVVSVTLTVLSSSSFKEMHVMENAVYCNRILRNYCLLVLESSEDEFGCLLDSIPDVIMQGLSILMEDDSDQFLSLAYNLYNVSVRTYKKKKYTTAVIFGKAFSEAVYSYIQCYSLDKITALASKDNANVAQYCGFLQFCYIEQKKYSLAMEAWAKWTYYFSPVYKEYFDRWLVLKKALLLNTNSEAELLKRTIQDQMKLQCDLVVSDSTILDWLKEEMSFFATKPGDCYQQFTNNAALQVVNFPGVSSIDKAVSQLILCLSVTTKGKPDWDFVEICESALKELENVTEKDGVLKLRMSMGYYSLWKYKAERLGAKLSTEEKLKHLSQAKKSTFVPKGDEEIPDKCDIVAAYTHFNLVTEMEVLKTLIPFNEVISDVLKQDDINWEDIETYYKNLLIEMMGNVADIFLGSRMISQAFTILGSLLQITHSLDKKQLWIEGILKMIDLLAEEGLPKDALKFCPFAENAIQELPKSSDKTFLENYLILLKSIAYFNAGEINKGLPHLVNLLSTMFQLSDADAKTVYWDILQSGAFLCLYKYQKTTPLARVHPRADLVGSSYYFSLSSSVILKKSHALAKGMYQNKAWFSYTRLPDNSHLSYYIYAQNLYLKVVYEAGKTFLDCGASREARGYLQEGLSVSKINLKTLLGASCLLELAYVDMLSNMKIDCDVKIEGFFYMLTYTRLEPIEANDTAMTNSSPLRDDALYELNTIHEIHEGLEDVDDDIFLSDSHKMKLTKAKLLHSFSHNTSCNCTQCQYSGAELLLLRALQLYSKTLCLEGKASEALSLLQVCNIHVEKVSQIEQAALNFMNFYFSGKTTLQRFGLESVLPQVKLVTVPKYLLDTFIFKLEMQDTFAECYSIMKQFDKASKAVSIAKRCLETESDALRPLMTHAESMLCFREASVVLNHTCQCKNIAVEDFFQASGTASKITFTPFHPVQDQRDFEKCSKTPCKEQSGFVKAQNAPKKKPQALFDKAVIISSNHLATPKTKIAQSATDNSDVHSFIPEKTNVLKEKNQLLTDEIPKTNLISSDSSSSPDSNLCKENIEKCNEITGSAFLAASQGGKSKRTIQTINESGIKKDTGFKIKEKAHTTLTPDKTGSKIKHQTRQVTKAVPTRRNPRRKATAKVPAAEADVYDVISSDEEQDVSKAKSYLRYIRKTEKLPSNSCKKPAEPRRETLRSDETSPPVSETIPTIETLMGKDCHLTKHNERPGFSVFEDDNYFALNRIVPHKSAVLNSLNILLWKAWNLSRHYPSSLLFKEINFLLGLVTNEYNNLPLAGYFMSKSVVVTLHLLWLTSLQAFKQTNQNVLLHEKIREETLHKEIYGPSDEKLRSSYEKVNNYNFIPNDLTVVQMNILSTSPILYSNKLTSTPPLVITRYQKNKEPLMCIIKIADEQFRYSFWKKLEQMFLRNEKSLKKSTASVWWEERHKLNLLLKDLCAEMESHWLGFYKCLLLGKISSEKKTSEVQDRCSFLINECKELGVSCKNPALLEVLFSAGSAITEVECFQATVTLFDSDDESKLREIHSLLYKYLQVVGNDEKEPTVLILDKFLHLVPWESMPLLRQKTVSRIPSLSTLKALLLSYEVQPSSIVKTGLNAKLGNCIINPDGSLSKTQDTLDQFVKWSNWAAIAGRIPTPEDMVAAVTNFDVYLYSGHGSGQVFLQREKIENKNCRAAAVVMGCSSGKLKQMGCLEPMGVVLQYLMGGCPFIMANLWDVTDADIDIFTMEFLKNWLVKEKGKKGSSKRSVALDLSIARSKCKLPYLVGSAPVVYGIPIMVTESL